MGLFRIAFWLGLVLLVLPVDRQAAGIEDGPGALETLFALQTTVQDMRGFCTRNPDACATGAETLEVMRQKAVYSAGLVQAWLASPDAAAPAAPLPAALPAGAGGEAVATLTPAAGPAVAPAAGDPLADLITASARAPRP